MSRTLLQWGHDLAVMESRKGVVALAGHGVLQWGHDLAVMERRAPQQGIVRDQVASMGP